MRTRRWLPPLLWAAVILALTSFPNPDLGGLDAVNFPGADKVTHGVLYAVLGFLSARAWLRRGSASDLRGAALILAGIAAFGAADEWHQQFIPGRGMSFLDWVADLAGASVALLLSLARHARPEPAS